MSLRICAGCSTRYALDLSACPHCGSSNFLDEEGVATQRLPLFIAVSCPQCGRGPWTLRLSSVATGLIELPTLACTSCGSRVPVTWPPEEEPMSPKITVHGGASNAHGADVSPADDVSQPQVAAEGDLGRLTSDEPEAVETTPEPEAEAAPEPEDDTVDYETLTLQELRDAATARDLPSYGTKAQITERLREADAAAEAE